MAGFCKQPKGLHFSGFLNSITNKNLCDQPRNLAEPLWGLLWVPDATTLAKGIVQIDPVGGIAVNAGVISLSASGVGPGTYTKVTVDSWAAPTAGAQLAAGDLPAHTHVAADIVSGALPFTIQNNGAAVGTRRALNLIQGASIGLTFLDVAASDRVDVTIALASVPAHVHAEADVTSLTTDLATLTTAVAGKAGASHNHDATNINSGTLDNARTSGRTSRAWWGTASTRSMSGSRFRPKR